MLRPSLADGSVCPGSVVLSHSLPIPPSANLNAVYFGTPVVNVSRTRRKNTREMNKVKQKHSGRPRRSQTDLDLHAIGERIRQLRGQSTQKDFAHSLTISQAQLSKYELGQSALPLGILVKLAQKSGRTADWILTG